MRKIWGARAQAGPKPHPAGKGNSFIAPISFISLSSLLLASLACNTLLPPRPAVEWDPQAETVIVEADTGGGMLYEPNALPDAVLLGDGTLRWVEHTNHGARQVYTAALTSDEMTALLSDFVNAGFFGWEPYYSPGIVYDAPSSCLHVSLVSETHVVCETLSGAPRAFGRLYQDLASGAGHAAEAVAFEPERGFLRVTDLGPALPGGSTLTADWPASALGVGLAELTASGGGWLEGEALAVAWNTINLAPLYPILRDGHYYQAQLLVPGVTSIQPPEEP